ncbi:tetraacyldisaccharide 4'-kinase, partial [candidate division GN15 bacterium]
MILRRGRYSPLNVPAFFLWLASFLYRAGARWRAMLRGKPVKVGVNVISVGNVTVGGSGKTPLV